MSYVSTGSEPGLCPRSCTLQAHLSRSAYNYLRRPQIRQRKQPAQLRRVLGQATKASRHITELALDHPEWVLHFEIGEAHLTHEQGLRSENT